MTREQAIAELVEQDVQKWGEAERQGSYDMHKGKTLGLALAALYSRAELAGDTARAKELDALSDAALTKADRRALKQGG